ncbi:unnamed protein product [Polarella glacialis]|uniref:Uncharacterized protein n=1 Tax=Polarella glacialis TaxID=89957 RepID=A0A813DML5_POLGL|nr:unnamed protein product [Polarella glacialis]
MLDLLAFTHDCPELDAFTMYDVLMCVHRRSCVCHSSTTTSTATLQSAYQRLLDSLGYRILAPAPWLRSGPVIGIHLPMEAEWLHVPRENFLVHQWSYFMF